MIGLLETDAARPYIGNHDILSWLSERLHMYADYGPGSKDHTWGYALVARKSCDSPTLTFPILSQDHVFVQVPYCQD